MPQLKAILAATDGSDQGGWAVVTGAALADRAGASFSVVSIVDKTALPGLYGLDSVEIADYERALLGEARRRAEAQIDEAGATVAAVQIESGVPATLVVKAADQVEADLIVLGAQRRSAVARLLAGSTAGRVIQLARCPVLTTTAARREPLRRVLAATDLSPRSNRVLDMAAAVAAIDGAKLRVLHVSEPLDAMMRHLALFDEELAQRSARSQLERSVSSLAKRADIPVESETRDGDAGKEILEEANSWEADLTVIGTHGFGFFERLLLGSTALHILRLARRPVLVVPSAET
ncbi:MAG: universal stress protein [Gemmatimonadota bacterium]|nr:MAG: universal stress protein [Gemmatimonadota bacterium]